MVLSTLDKSIILFLTVLFEYPESFLRNSGPKSTNFFLNFMNSSYALSKISLDLLFLLFLLF